MNPEKPILSAAATKPEGPPAPGPAIPCQATYPVSVESGEYELKTIIMDFVPGAVVPDHTHGGSVFGMVLSGEITLKDRGTARIVKTGESWAENSSSVHSAVNAGPAPARIVVNILLPKGAEATIFAKPHQAA